MKRIICTAALFFPVSVYLGSGVVLSQVAPAFTKDKIYINTRTYTDETGTKYRDNVQYYDSFGLPSEAIQVGASASGHDIISLEEYDQFYRKSYSWLPAVKSGNKGAYIAEWALGDLVISSNGNDQAPYSRTVYEMSALNRVQAQYGPGQDWHKTYGADSKAIRTDYLVNTADGDLSCAEYTCGAGTDMTITKKGNFAAGELYVAKTTDEDGRVSYNFKDKQDRIVLSRRMAGVIPHDTYYIYDNPGNLRAVLPPMASDVLISTNTPWSAASPAVRNYAYLYQYDGRRRCIYKRLPGCEPVYYVYDKAGRLVFTQDGQQRNGKNEWTFAIPDAHGRTVLTGQCTNSLNYQANPLEDILVNAAYTGGTNAFKGYTVSGVSLASPAILSASYYDDYAFLNTNGISDGVYLSEAGFAAPYPDSKGLLTGTLTAQLEPGGAVSSDYLYSVKYYDNRGRVIQVAEKVIVGTSRVNYKYDFVGNPLQVKERQSVQGLQTEIQTAYTYDHAGRRLSEKVSVNGVEQAAVAYTHDEVGRLASQKYAKGSWSTTETMGYNIRSWLTEKSGSYFSMQLRYNNVLSPASTRHYGGGISEWTWQHSGGPNNMYSLQYDDADRLSGAQQYVASGPNWVTATSHYSENGISYDKNGNILTLQRSAGGSMVDNLTYGYDGNRLSALTESVASPGAADILVQGGSPQGTYSYNANGNMVYDSRKNLTYGYNILNLTDVVKQGQTVKATYKWSANGAKLSVRDGSGTNGFDYAGSVVYAKNALGTNVDAIHFDHGVIRKQADGYMVNFFIADHLGSTRVVVDSNGTVLEKNDYYPFGAKHKRNDYLASDNRYKYNGKEEQVVGDVGFLDYGARMYDPGTARWMVVDPLAEVNRSWSPYRYAYDNPLRYIDEDGMIERDPVTGKIVFSASGTQTHVVSQDKKYLMTYDYGTIKTNKGRRVFVEKLASVQYKDKEGKTVIVDASKTSVNGIPMSQFMANCHGLTFGDGEFFIDGEAAGKILKDEYTDLGNVDNGRNPTEVPDHDVMTVGGSQIGEFWEPFHSGAKKANGYRSKNDIGPVEEGKNRNDETNYVKYEKGTEGFNQIMNYLRKYFKKNEEDDE